MNRFKFSSLLQVIIVIAVVALLAALLVPAVVSRAHAQPYYTNTTPANGAYQYNDSLTPPLTPTITGRRQFADGINYGSLTTVGGGTVTNTFSTNYVYSAAPTVIVSQTGTATTVSNIVTVTTTNFIWNAGKAGATASFIAIGK